jgi:CheY-like chemotaxis protein
VEDIDKLFRDYSQLDTGANRKYEGTGLGLAITKRLVEMMGGTMTVESEYGKGSCFTAQIIQQLTEKEEEKPQSTQSTQRDSLDPNIHLCDLRTEGSSVLCGEKFLPNARVLAVDDVAGNLLLIRKMLAPYGVVVNTADSGKEAVGMIEAGKYDLIFMDHMMPGMDGIQTLQKIKEKSHLRSGENRKEECPPIIMLTATAMTGMKEYYLEQGFDDYLSKPINAKKLDEILRRWLANDDHSSFEHTPLAISVETKERQLDKLKHNRFTLLMKLKGALESGEAIEAESILDKMGNIFTEPEDRALYFKLYHLMLTGDTDKMLEEINRNEE